VHIIFRILIIQRYISPKPNNINNKNVCAQPLAIEFELNKALKLGTTSCTIYEAKYKITVGTALQSPAKLSKEK
jgi:hypothetical protein